MKAQFFTRRLIAAIAIMGLAASQAAYASPPDPALIALDSGQKQLGSTALIVKDTGQATIARAVITEKIDIDAVANTARIRDTGQQHETVPAALVVTPAANIDTDAEYVPIDTSPSARINANDVVISAVTIGTIAARAPQKELDTSPPIGGQLVVTSDALGIDNTDTGQPIAGYAGFQVLALSA